MQSYVLVVPGIGSKFIHIHFFQRLGEDSAYQLKSFIFEAIYSIHVEIVCSTSFFGYTKFHRCVHYECTKPLKLTNLKRKN